MTQRDIVERLRASALHCHYSIPGEAVLTEAANYIAQLREELAIEKQRAKENHAHRAVGTNPKCQEYIAKLEAKLSEEMRDHGETQIKLEAKLMEAEKRRCTHRHFDNGYPEEP